MASTDRRQIAPLLLKHFPGMANATSDEWHGFLNAKTGRNVDINEPNGNAFDVWRQALAEDHALPVWKYTPARIEEIKQRGEQLKALEDARLEAQPVTLAKIAEIAPTPSWDKIVANIKKAWA